MSLNVEAIAESLGLKKEELIKNGVRAYLESELRRINAEIMAVYNRYGVKSLSELDEKINKGKLSETETLEDFTKFSKIYLNWWQLSVSPHFSILLFAS
jgi:hypothetical protein